MVQGWSATLYSAAGGRFQSLPRGAARRLAAAGVALGLALAAGGCSLSFPIIGFTERADPEPQTTASVKPVAAPPRGGALVTLGADLGPEDMRRADAAFAVALDPQGNGAAVSWDNPQSGIKGAFTPVGGPFVSADEICRGFTASVHTQTRLVRLQGRACRPSGGEWAVKETQAIKSAA